MGLNDFVSLFYGSAQSLHTPSSVVSTNAVDGVVANSSGSGRSSRGSELKTKTAEMLKNHKNSKLPKFQLTDFASDKKISRNMTLTSMKTPRQKGIRCGESYDSLSKSVGGGCGDVPLGLSGLSGCSGGSGGGGGGGVSGGDKNVSDKKYRTLAKSSFTTTPSSNVNANASATATAAVGATVRGNPLKSSSLTDGSGGGTAGCSGTEMDLLKATGLRKKSSFLWNSFRMPRKQKGDHNRILNPTNTPSSAKINSKSETPAEELQENGIGLSSNNNNNNNSIHSTTSIRTTTSTTGHSAEKSPANIKTVSRTSSLILSTINNKKTQSASTQVNATISEKKISNKLQDASSKSPPTSSSSTAVRKSLLHKQHQQLSEEVVVIPSSEPVDDLQQLKLLNRHSFNGALNYETLEKHQLELQHWQQQNEHQSKTTEALGVLLQYLVYDLDAFSCPSLKAENAQAKEKLQKTLLSLDEAKAAYSELQDQLCDKEAYYTQRENELQALHRCELEKAHANIVDMQSLSRQQISELQCQMESYRMEMEKKLSDKGAGLKSAQEHERSMQQRLQILEATEHELRERLTHTESSYATRLQLAAEREQELTNCVKLLTNELDKLKASKESSERDLKEKLNLSNDEIAILRTTRRSLNDNCVTTPRSTSSCSAMGTMELSRLHSEAESLRCVLELKQKEISKLTKHNEELLRDADEKLGLQGKISLLESQNEMLHSELDIKSEKEKEYVRQIDEIQKAYSHETVKRTRLSYDNEALQWQLKQRSEQLHLVETKLQELSAHDIALSSSNDRSSMNGSALIPSIRLDESISPVIKGVIEKIDSVSWVLEMDDETPEAAASKMVKRAGSFRSVERSPCNRRHLSVSASAVQHNNSSLTDSSGPNPLSQSMSATSVIREHSKVETNEFNPRSHPRIRSKSVSVKSCEVLQPHKSASAKFARQLSSGSSRQNNEASPWKDPTIASSPYCIRPRSSTMKIDNEQHQEEVLFRRSNKLITCDTSALNKGERLEMRSLPSHPSVQDLKAVKKCQEIQESAGEAMVSGTNSEDESCSASSDDVVSSASSSANSDSNNSANQMKNTRMSIDDVLLIEKINSFSGTPMEVSWSDDVDGLANSSTL